MSLDEEGAESTKKKGKSKANLVAGLALGAAGLIANGVVNKLLYERDQKRVDAKNEKVLFGKWCLCSLSSGTPCFERLLYTNVLCSLRACSCRLCRNAL